MSHGISKALVFCALGLVVNQAPALQVVGAPSSGSTQATVTADASGRSAVNVRSKGVITVSLLSTDAFNTQDVKPQSIRLGPGGAKPFGRVQSADLNGDGSTDLLLHFKTQDTGITCGATDVSLTGMMLDGQRFTASYPIETKGC